MHFTPSSINVTLKIINFLLLNKENGLLGVRKMIVDKKCNICSFTNILKDFICMFQEKFLK